MWEGPLKHVGKGAVSDVVEESSGEGVLCELRGDSVFWGEGVLEVAEPKEESLHDVGCADGVCEASVFGTWVGKGGVPELTNASEALNLFGFEKSFDHEFVAGFESDESVDGVTKNHGNLLSAVGNGCNAGCVDLGGFVVLQGWVQATGVRT